MIDGVRATVSLARFGQPRLDHEIVFAFARAPAAGLSLATLQSCGWQTAPSDSGFAC